VKTLIVSPWEGTPENGKIGANPKLSARFSKGSSASPPIPKQNRILEQKIKRLGESLKRPEK